MAGRLVATSADKLARHPSGGPAGATLLSDENGFDCCCTEPDCCDSCARIREFPAAGCGTCSGGISTPDDQWPDENRVCCFTRDSDLPVDGYWYMREDLGPNFWTIEVTQTGVASWGGSGSASYWEFTVDVIEQCRVNNQMTTDAYSDTVRLLPGFERSIVSNNTCNCRHLNLPFNFAQAAGCWRTRWDGLFHPLRVVPQQNPADQFASGQNCYQDLRSGVGGPIPRSNGLVTISFYYRVDKCADRCSGDCSTCP